MLKPLRATKRRVCSKLIVTFRNGTVFNEFWSEFTQSRVPNYEIWHQQGDYKSVEVIFELKYEMLEQLFRLFMKNDLGQGEHRDHC